MCSNYRAVTRADWLLNFFGVGPAETGAESIETWPTGQAPYIRLNEAGKRIAATGHFGLLPHFAKDIAYGRKTYNARSETVAKLPSFSTSWQRGQRCIIPAECIYEPFYATATSKPVRWAIRIGHNIPMGIAGVYNTWRDPEGREHGSFAMLTVNADDHPVMSRFHAWGEEKRMVVILDSAEKYDEWLTCSVDEAPSFFQQYRGTLETEAAPLPPRAAKPKAPPKPPADEPPAPATGDLF